ncbi:MAG: helix-turn-helix domain-containing protein [Bacteroidetes bacterium]|nr:helix-turn-helix domain-containing protein [Bacteroidota bacterium]
MKNDTKHAISDKMPELVGRAYQYHLRGLNAKEIGKLIDTNPRTVQRWIAQYKFAENAAPTPLKQRAYNLYQKGLSYTAIAKALRKSRSMVYYYIRELRENDNAAVKG